MYYVTHAIGKHRLVAYNVAEAHEIGCMFTGSYTITDDSGKLIASIDKPDYRRQSCTAR